MRWRPGLTAAITGLCLMTVKNAAAQTAASAWKADPNGFGLRSVGRIGYLERIRQARG
jgi:hypothetical protein